MKNRAWLLKGLFISLLITGCAPTPKVIDGYRPGVSLVGMELDESQSPSLVYRRQGASPLTNYKKFIVEPIVVRYTNEKMKRLDPVQIGKMQSYFHNSMVKTIQEKGYTVLTQAEPDTLRLRFYLTGLKAPMPASNIASMAFGPFAISVGEVTVEAHFIDAPTDSLSALVVTRTSGSHVLNAKPLSTWGDIESVFDQWAAGFVKALKRD